MAAVFFLGVCENYGCLADDNVALAFALPPRGLLLSILSEGPS